MIRHDGVHIPAKSVLLESGDVVEVAPFVISRLPVSLRQFREFAGATGYVTSAERAGEEDIFKDNYVLREYSKSFVERSPVQFVSYLDADAYCRWAGVSLPSEHQWIAAATVDNSVYDHAEAGALLPELRRKMLIDVRGGELTSNLAEGKVVVRSGPIIVRWQQSWPGKTRQLYGLDRFDPGLNFRVVVT